MQLEKLNILFKKSPQPPLSSELTKQSSQSIYIIPTPPSDYMEIKKIYFMISSTILLLLVLGKKVKSMYLRITPVGCISQLSFSLQYPLQSFPL